MAAGRTLVSCRSLFSAPYAGPTCGAAAGITAQPVSCPISTKSRRRRTRRVYCHRRSPPMAGSPPGYRRPCTGRAGCSAGAAERRRPSRKWRAPRPWWVPAVPRRGTFLENLGGVAGLQRASGGARGVKWAKTYPYMWAAGVSEISPRRVERGVHR
jgi:hypothetical protein